MNPTLILELVPAFLRALEALAQLLPVKQLPTVSSVLTTAASLIEAGEAGYSEFQTLAQHVQSLVASGTNPTDADISALQARSDAAHISLQQASLSFSNTPTT